jgi:hypothetical protein
MMLRRHLRLLVLLWLACQTAALSAFGPASCCPAHRQSADNAIECQGDAAGECPMHASSEPTVATAATECPMHAADGTPTTPCVMRGLCNGPAAALSMLLSVPGVLTATTELAVAQVSLPFASVPARAHAFTVSHDTPPPRF